MLEELAARRSQLATPTGFFFFFNARRVGSVRGFPGSNGKSEHIYKTACRPLNYSPQNSEAIPGFSAGVGPHIRIQELCLVLCFLYKN